MSNWILTNIEINYPSLNGKHKPISSKTKQYCAIDHLTFKYDDYCLSLYFNEDLEKKYIFEINKITKINVKNKIKTNYELLAEGDIKQTSITNELTKLNLPQFSFKFKEIVFSPDVDYFYMENDDDYNYEAEENINLIKSGDYGYVIEYVSKYTIKEYPDNETESNAIKQIINNGIKDVFEHFFESTNETLYETLNETLNETQTIILNSIPNINQLLNEINSMKAIELNH